MSLLRAAGTTLALLVALRCSHWSSRGLVCVSTTWGGWTDQSYRADLSARRRMVLANHNPTCIRHRLVHDEICLTLRQPQE